MSKNNEDFYKEKKPWSIIKDQLLGSYLKPYFAKILATQKPIFYVDAFAGKGMFDDGDPGSPVIALDIISEALEKTQFRKPNIKSCFIELNHAHALRDNIKNYKNVDVVEGKYEENIDLMLEGKQLHNVFLYIDPYGIKSLHFSIFEKLSSKRLYSVELLINLNSFGFIREACNAMDVVFDIEELEDLIEIEIDSSTNNKKSILDLNGVAGGDYWQEIIQEYNNEIIDGYEAEMKFSEMYCERLKDHFRYVLNMPIRLKRGQRPKYRMIHATNHPAGCVLMNDNMCKRWEAVQDLQNQGQLSFFTEDVENRHIYTGELQAEILEVMSTYKDYVDIEVFYADFVSKYGVRLSTSDIRNELKQLFNSRKIDVKRHPKKTVQGKASTFWTTGKGKTIKVRCL
ncbi:three-Cys-motif partner protein TcmP [Desulfofalx alkaliphila]|uniref:three-Cys-motif partner protein TcmP n=1 Tax=Desulfofalx alkaliphila TaxID=105483 RepID=UPI0004E23A27|nr:three-Cys-motif partner protein TcmP [Desulfofalx alkaliphila]